MNKTKEDLPHILLVKGLFSWRWSGRGLKLSAHI